MKSNIVIVLLAILTLILGFVSYFFSTNTFISPVKYEKEIAQVEKTSESDNISDIEKDLDATEFDNLDAELSAIEAELD